MDPTAKLGPLSAPATLNTESDRAVPDTSGSGSTSHGKAAAAQPLRVTAPSTTTVVTHPTPTTTVTTVTQTIVKPAATTIVTTVTTTSVRPATPVNAITPTIPAPTTTTTTVRTTTTTPTPAPTPAPTPSTPAPAVSGNGTVPDAPASLGAPSTMVLDDEFNTGSLNTSLWSPDWYGNGQVQNGTLMVSSDVSVGANGLALQLNSPQSGGIVSTNPGDDQPGHTGFQIAPSPSKPVYVEWKATLPSTASGGVANWPGLWLVGQPPWPENGEIDVMEGGGGVTAYHIHFGNQDGEGADGPGQVVDIGGGTHTFGVLWTTTSVTFVYDGAVVGTIDQALDSPMSIVMENSYSSVDPTVFPSTLYVRYLRVWN